MPFCEYMVQLRCGCAAHGSQTTERSCPGSCGKETNLRYEEWCPERNGTGKPPCYSCWACQEHLDWWNARRPGIFCFTHQALETQQNEL